ncbi:MAG: Ycf48-like protein [Chlorobi bacterium]|nr:MAG: Ycf48-like protein [Chlorobi bacterium OLB6]MBV6462661.1 Ycf48-like protein [Chlorobiota bacterium]
MWFVNIPMTLSTRTYRGLLLGIISVLVTLPTSAQWVKASLPLPYSTGYYLDVFFLKSDPRYGWACSIEGYVVRTTDGGITWRGSQTSRKFLEYIQFLTPLIGYTSGPAGLYKSTDGGATWRDITPPDPNGEQGWGSYFLNQNEGVYLVGGCATSVQAFYRTTDGGVTFTASYQTEPRSGLSDALLYDDGSGYALSSGVLWNTSDYGRSWRKYAKTPRKVWHEELSIVGSTIMIPWTGEDCAGAGSKKGGILLSHDKGLTWTDVNIGEAMFGTFLIDEKRGWAVGDNKTVYYTSDGGLSWINKNCGVSGNLDDIFFIGDSVGWIGGSGLYKYVPVRDFKTVSIMPSDTTLTICRTDSVLLTASAGYALYTWSDGVQGQSRYASAAGTYRVVAYDTSTCLESSDSITIRHYPEDPAQIIAPVLEVCQGDSVRLEFKGNAVSQRWSTSDTAKVIYISTTTSVSVEYTDVFGCSFTLGPVAITVHPRPDPVITTNRNTTICRSETITLSAPEGYTSYEWSNGATSKDITVSQPGEYTVRVQDQYGCTATSASVTIVVLDIENRIELMSALTPAFVLPETTVGSARCADVLIRNKSTSEELVISRPLLVHNLWISIPQAQLPIRLGPLQTGRITLCFAPVDTGAVADTLILPDTCSPTIIPVLARGAGEFFSGTSRCDVAIKTFVYRAGVSHYLSNPYPQPANSSVQLTIKPALQNVRAVLVDFLGRHVAEAEVTVSGSETAILFRTHGVPAGRYAAILMGDQGEMTSVPVGIIH